MKRTRSLFVAAVALILMVVVIPGVGARNEPESTVTGVELIGEVGFPTGFRFDDTEVGGLSAITYDEKRGIYFSLSDDRSQFDPARFYTLAIDVGDGSLDEGDIVFVDTTTLLDETGAPYPPAGIDPEGMVIGRPGQLFVSSEGDTLADPVDDPFVRRYNRDGALTADFPVPDKFLPSDDGTTGPRFNLSFESLAVTPDVKSLITATEGALLQDGPAADVGVPTLVRVLTYDLNKRDPIVEYAYVADAVAEAPDPPNAFRVSGLVELLPIDNAGTMLALERSFSVGQGNTVRLFEVRFQGATDVSDVADLTAGGYVAAEKRLLADFEADFGIVADNLEGMTFGPALPDGRQLLIVVSDNNFNPVQVTQFLAIALEVVPVP